MTFPTPHSVFSSVSSQGAAHFPLAGMSSYLTPKIPPSGVENCPLGEAAESIP